MWSEEREFRPTRLSASELSNLRQVIEAATPGGSLSICRDLRDYAEQRASQEGLVQLRQAVAASILADLCEQEWMVKARGEGIVICAPDWSSGSGHEVERIKSRIRNSLQLTSDRQIASAAVQAFLKSMERPRSLNGRVVSIASVIDDGEDLRSRIASALGSKPEQLTKRLSKLFRPYVMVCDERSVCAYTGLPMLDIWRYFRHTWALEYNPLPGRTLRFVVRNAARPNHPVMGIAMLSSPAANLYIRDQWIGWRLEDVISGLMDGSLDAKVVAKTLHATLDEAISEIRSDDLISAHELDSPNESVLFRLRQLAGLAAAQRRGDLVGMDAGDASDKVVDIRDFQKDRLGRDDWRALSETSLFVRKRAEQLIPLLRARAYFCSHNFAAAPAAALYEALVTAEGRSVISFLLTVLRTRKLATEVADLAVCGAAPPYSDLLGGKLVTMLMASEEVRKAYAERYGDQVSEIASQMAGRPIVRSSELHVITTTSLYGVSSSQYNRIKVQAGPRSHEWSYLGNTKGMTVTHLTKLTLGHMRELARAEYGTRRVNSVFGEGSSPKTRQIREGLNLIGINNDSVLLQSVGRRVYACELFPGARAALTGLIEKRRKGRGVSERALSSAWLDRWLVRRVQNPEVMQRMRSNNAASVSRQFKQRALRGSIETENDGSLLAGMQQEERS